MFDIRDSSKPEITGYGEVFSLYQKVSIEYGEVFLLYQKVTRQTLGYQGNLNEIL